VSTAAQISRSVNRSTPPTIISPPSRTAASCVSLAEHDLLWERCGEPKAFGGFFSDWKPNLFHNLVPQDGRLTLAHCYGIAERYCYRVQREVKLKGGHKERFAGAMAFLIERADGVGYHAHGIARFPPEMVPFIAAHGETWLREEVAKYRLFGLPERLAVSRNLPSAVISPISSPDEVRKCICYMNKNWYAERKYCPSRMVLLGSAPRG
jgi:hypothetical protein